MAAGAAEARRGALAVVCTGRSKAADRTDTDCVWWTQVALLSGRAFDDLADAGAAHLIDEAFAA